eukprot:835420-Pleurochrysis_carterae.AAC.3
MNAKLVMKSGHLLAAQAVPAAVWVGRGDRATAAASVGARGTGTQKVGAETAASSGPRWPSSCASDAPDVSAPSRVSQIARLTRPTEHTRQAWMRLPSA